MSRSLLEIRPDMFRLANDMDELGYSSWARELRQLALDTLRARHKPTRAPKRSRKLTRDLAYAIRAFAVLHPDWSNEKIGRQFGVNGGRVTDAHDRRKTYLW